jgi:hypothetical protein
VEGQIDDCAQDDDGEHGSSSTLGRAGIPGRLMMAVMSSAARPAMAARPAADARTMPAISSASIRNRPTACAAALACRLLFGAAAAAGGYLACPGSRGLLALLSGGGGVGLRGDAALEIGLNDAGVGERVAVALAAAAARERQFPRHRVTCPDLPLPALPCGASRLRPGRAGSGQVVFPQAGGR